MTEMPTSIVQSRSRTSSDASEKRRAEKLHRDKFLRNFLKSHGFGEELNEPRGGASCFVLSPQKNFFPIHVAAKLGQPELVRAMIKARADLQVRDSAGRTPLDVAQFANRYGSHQRVIEELRLNVISMRDAVDLMIAQKK